uniref:hypothetical protein n=1 Tax=uncultured Leifsonia sp. TaxID=340359 RepID=UPI0028D7F0DF
MTISDGDAEGTPIFESTRQTHDEPVTSGGMSSGGMSGSGGLGGSSSGQSAGGTAQAAKQEAGRVADSAVDAGKDVAAVAKDEAANVAQETKEQAKDLYRQTQQELREQAALQQERVASGLRSIGDELQQMAGASEAQGVASDLVGQAARRTQAVASWLDERDPGSLLQEVKSYARRNPGTFIAAAAVAGALAGRLTRALASGGD